MAKDVPLPPPPPPPASEMSSIRVHILYPLLTVHCHYPININYVLPQRKLAEVAEENALNLFVYTQRTVRIFLNIYNTSYCINLNIYNNVLNFNIV